MDRCAVGKCCVGRAGKGVRGLLKVSRVCCEKASLRFVYLRDGTYCLDNSTNRCCAEGRCPEACREVALHLTFTSGLDIEVEGRKRDKVVVVELRLERQISTSLIEVELVVDVTVIGNEGSKHERFIEPISRPKGGLEAGSGVSFEAALRDELTDQVIPLEISVQLVEVNTITVQ